MTAALRVIGVTKRFGGLTALDNVTLDIQPALVTSIIGQNGAGKTTLVNAIVQTVPPDEGQVFAGADELTGLRPYAVVSRGVARSFQQLRLFPHLTVLENVLVGMQGSPGERIVSLMTSFAACRSAERGMLERVRAILERLGLSEIAGQDAGDLSYGLQKILSLARLLATDAGILILDEPTSGLSNDYVTKVTDAIRSMRADGKTIILIEHDMEVVFEFSDFIIVLDQGKLFASGTPRDVRMDQRVRDIYLGG
ncbi:MAG: ABC transporter ATP-binding protein [Xanthobacteraceae bacterium]|nr:ABC transporter ATP-binding protein [Xanthobacteraceae bacterium]